MEAVQVASRKNWQQSIPVIRSETQRIGKGRKKIGNIFYYREQVKGRKITCKILGWYNNAAGVDITRRNLNNNFDILPRHSGVCTGFSSPMEVESMSLLGVGKLIQGRSSQNLGQNLCFMAPISSLLIKYKGSAGPQAPIHSNERQKHLYSMTATFKQVSKHLDRSILWAHLFH